MNAPDSIWELVYEPFSRVAALMTLMEFRTSRWFLGAGNEPLLERQGDRLVVTDYGASLAEPRDEKE